MNVIENLKHLTESISLLYENSLNDLRLHKFAAHERVFKLVLNLSTLSITGWMAVVSWNFEPFSEQKFYVYISCLLFILSLLLVSLGDICIMLQSLFSEKVVSHHKQEFFVTKNQVNGLIISHTDFSQITKEELHKKGTSRIVEDINKVTAVRSKDERKAVFFGKFSWYTGMAGYFMFFCSATFLVYSMSNYVAKAQEIRTQTKEKIESSESDGGGSKRQTSNSN